MKQAASRDAAVVTPWYPTRELPFRGSFVQAMVDATAPGCDSLVVYHCDPWVAAMDAATTEAVEAANARLMPGTAHRVPTVGGAELVHFPVTTPRGQDYGAQARNHERQLRNLLGGKPIDAPVVHAHVGLPSGWAALRNARPDARVFVTEHASFLERVFQDPEARELYDELLGGVTGFFAVGDKVTEVLGRTFPHHADKILRIPNPISFDQPRPEPVTALNKWLYLGGMVELKGVNWLVEAFAQCHAEDPSLTLTMVGEGPLRRPLTERVAELGLSDAVKLPGSIPHEEALGLMREHDLLVHPSRYETFGMTIVEGIAAGMPVLVTRCGGPERTLAGIEDAAGELIDVEENAESISDGFRRLRDRFAGGGLDLERARARLSEQYGYEAVARAHYRLWFPDAEDTENAEDTGDAAAEAGPGDTAAPGPGGAAAGSGGAAAAGSAGTGTASAGTDASAGSPDSPDSP
ncbi:glycosyltransferase family 4 protein [Streptomyces sp. LP05-1]|uniref:D-inositol 3-phosphate glycosyltransferase n=1 Tax=Streptomyces pyxinae TaxID=2970734 RepID=A0ABT2CL12_9ACTN|nr:glycosyltransferase family 4 protein [Streptomyces sp. LP05-1]MCS0638109.1 glycosyltransferase family 4 protein [Streptomyces sp. LP05-1]